jgi:aminoglycoside phosphotransferase (APT) family kinase protein
MFSCSTPAKPGKRCVIEYDVRVEHPDGRREKAVLIGKIRARRYGNEACRLQEALWNAGFQTGAPDRVSVPEPIGLVPPMRMWLQRKVPGTVATELLTGPEGVALARRVAKALHKLHRAGVSTHRRHTMADELRILRQCLWSVARAKPDLAPRLERLLEACERLGAQTPPPVPCGIHRDFYPDQVIVRGKRLHLLDFDLYCLGDPALDVGNFLGHVIEQSLREHDRPDAMRDREVELEERFIRLTGQHARPAVPAYTTLTLARHIYLSTQFAGRSATTDRLVDLCEERLELAARTVVAI